MVRCAGAGGSGRIGESRQHKIEHNHPDVTVSGSLSLSGVDVRQFLGIGMR